jgi:signal transduction histidine kinase
MRNDTIFAVLLTGVVIGWANIWPENESLSTWGLVLAIAATLPLAARRRWPIPVLATHVAFSVVYNTMDNPHDALMPPALVALYTVASTGRLLRSLIVCALTCLVVLAVRAVNDGTIGTDTLGTLGWLVAAIVLGEATRNRNAEIERQGDQKVIEERLRIARDLHDLLAHTITTIRVQAGVAAHLITEADHIDRATVTTTLDTITDACDNARTELRATVEVLRDPIPALPRLTDLAGPVQAAGITTTIDNTGATRPLPPAVELTAYRIVQESLTNVVKHSAATHVTITLNYGPDTLIVTVADNGHGAKTATGGHGITGMTERARSIGGHLTVRSDSGFTVTAELPTGEP